MTLTTALSGFSVLLVEPSQMQANLIARMLEHLGMSKVQRLDSGQDALAALRLAPEDHIVISSMYLPDMSGVDLVGAMRLDPALETVPFILISSETRPQVLDPVRQSGACSIITKPFSEEQLSRSLLTAAEQLHPLENLEMAQLEDLRVLVVDDSLAARRHLRRLLTDLGIENIREAQNGLEAVALLQDSLVDLVITDYNMPEMDGQQLIEYIRTQSWQSTVPVLMVTSEQNSGRLAAVERAGVSAICDKPFDARNVRQLIVEALMN